MKKLLTAIALTLPMTATADLLDDSLEIARESIYHIGAKSSHVGFSSDNVTNETHELFAIENNGYVAGYYPNSYDDPTVFALKTFRHNVTERLQLQAAVGFNYGYKECYGAGEPGDSATICLDGYIGAGYAVTHFLNATVKYKPGVVIFAPEVKFTKGFTFE